MKKQLVWFVLLLGLVLAGCNDENEVLYVTDDEFLIKNGIEDVVRVFQVDRVEKETMVIYYGNRKGKDWFALFDAKSGILLEEWYGKDREYVKPEYDAPSAMMYRLFSKLKSGDYVYEYHFYQEGSDGSDDISQLVRLRDNQKVEYGFEFDGNIRPYKALTENRFLASRGEYKSVIVDFEGNICVEDARTEDRGELEQPWYTGFQGDKVWIGYYDEEENFQEVVSSEKFERNRKVHIGYGEYEEFYIDHISITEVLETDRGYAFCSNYGDADITDVFFINEDKLVFVPSLQIDYYNSVLRNWYDGSILVEGRLVLSVDGEIIMEYQSSMQKDDEPLSYDEVIRQRYVGNGFARYNCLKNEIVWSVYIDKLDGVKSDAKVTMTLLEKNGEEWSYQCEIVNRDGSKSCFKFELNVETGKITYL